MNSDHPNRNLARGRRRPGVALLVAAALLSVLGGAAPVSAHEGRAVVTLEENAPVTDTSVRYQVRAVWDNDGHPAADATVTAVAEGPDGERVGPIPMDPVDDDGRYATTVQFPGPGAWTVRFTVVTPPGSLERSETVPVPVAPTDPGGTGEPSTSPANPTTTSTSAPAQTTPPDTGDVAATDADDEGSSSSGAAVFFFVTAAVILGACILAYRSRHKRTGAEP